MSSRSVLDRLTDRIVTQRNAVIAAAILVAAPIAYAFYLLTDSTSGDFLLLMTLAIGVPTAYDEYWPHYAETRLAVGWTVAACLLATVEFVALFLVGVEVLGLPELYVETGAFLVVNLANSMWLVARNREVLSADGEKP